MSRLYRSVARRPRHLARLRRILGHNEFREKVGDVDLGGERNGRERAPGARAWWQALGIGAHSQLVNWLGVVAGEAVLERVVLGERLHRRARHAVFAAEEREGTVGPNAVVRKGDSRVRVR